LISSLLASVHRKTGASLPWLGVSNLIFIFQMFTAWSLSHDTGRMKN